jgi:Superinfection immunity protein
MLILAILIYFLPTIVALSRGHLSALAIFFLNLFLGWTLIGWFIAFIWSCTGNTEANFHRLDPDGVGLSGRVPPRRSSGSLWLVLILILLGIVLLDKRRDFRDVRSFDFTFPSQGDVRF